MADRDNITTRENRNIQHSEMKHEGKPDLFETIADQDSKAVRAAEIERLRISARACATSQREFYRELKIV